MADEEFIEGDEFDPEFLARQEAAEKQQAEDTGYEQRVEVRARMHSYKAVYVTGNPTKKDLEVVLNDLGYFCKEHTALYNIKDGANATELMLIKEGRREVFQRIKDFANLDEDVLLLKYHKPT